MSYFFKSLHFSHQQEQEYQQVYFLESLPITRVALLLTMILYGSFSILDILVIPDEFSGDFFIVRFAIVLPVIFLVIACSWHRSFYRYWQYLLVFAAIVGGTGIGYMVIKVPDNSFYYGGLMLTFTALYFFIRLRFIYASISGFGILLITNLMMIFSGNLEPKNLISYNFFYISANLIGMFASYYIELNSRRNFSLTKELNQSKDQLEDVNRNLETLVANRTSELIESEQRFRNLADLLPLIVYEVNREGIITYVNQQGLRQFDVSNEEIKKGMSILTFVVPELRKRAWENLRHHIDEALNSRKEYRAIKKDGTVFPVMDYSSPIIKNGKVVGQRSVVVDLREQKANEQLRTDIAVALQSAKFKQNFLANMSHEIRTPLTGIMGLTEILASTPLNKTQKEYINGLRQSTESLREIINQILDYSKIEAGKIVLKPVVIETNSVFDNAITLFGSICQKPIKLITVVSDELPENFMVDIMRVQQIISNFLSNAIKFTNHGYIKLIANLKHQVTEDTLLVEIRVEDSGIGIDPAKHQMLFEPFTQIDYTDTRHIDGTGLGLTICKDLARLLGGEIGVESEPGTGSTFWFTFVARTAKKSKQQREKIHVSGNGSAGSSLRILLVEDKVINQKVISLILTSQGHKVTTASNGQEGVEIFHPDHFDMVLMDIQMPVMDGIAATEMIRKKYDNQPLIVGLSANAFEGDREKYLALGLDDYLTKPVRGDDFKELLSRWFQ